MIPVVFPKVMTTIDDNCDEQNHTEVGVLELERVSADRTHMDVVKIAEETLHVNAVRREEIPFIDGKQDGRKDVVQDMDRIVDELGRKLQKLVELFRGEAEFSVDKELDKIIVKIKDRESGEIIRQIPPEVAIKIAKSINELVGLLFDEKG